MPNRPRTDHDALIAELWRNRALLKTIAHACDRSERSVLRVVARLGLPRRRAANGVRRGRGTRYDQNARGHGI